MLINFTLDPIDQIPPWGNPPDLSLHWFGLTSGTYFMQVGPEQLLRYSDECIARFESEFPAERKTPFVDYQVTRIYEDIFEILPHVLEPIPVGLIERASSKSCRTWMNACKAWMDGRPENDTSAWDRYYESVSWIGKRSLDTCYLSPNARIWFWRFGDAVTIEWDNRDKHFEDMPAWAAQQGSFSLSVDEFHSELLTFRRSFLEAMSMRVAEVCRSWSRPDVRIDLSQLVAEQKMRESLTDGNPRLDAPTDWQPVISAINAIESTGTKFGPG